MGPKQTPPGKKKPVTNQESSDPRKNSEDRKPAPSQKESSPDAPSREELETVWREPITNQDEQKKIINDESGDIPIPKN